MKRESERNGVGERKREWIKREKKSTKKINFFLVWIRKEILAATQKFKRNGRAKLVSDKLLRLFPVSQDISQNSFHLGINNFIFYQFLLSLKKSFHIFFLELFSNNYNNH